MKTGFLVLISTLVLFACSNNNVNHIAEGQMPQLATDHSGIIHLIYGSGDSILYRFSSDQGHTFSPESLVSVLPALAASHMRGPQIAASSNGLIVTACNNMGDIFSFTKTGTGKWSQAARVNDVDTTAKENLMALAADGNTAFAAWLDLRDGHNRIYGARSTDGGRSWSENLLVYASPDTTVCECCKPSVAVNGNNVYVMFRNWLDGNRDLYLARSSDGGNSFGKAEKLGRGSWALDGCPMDGGGLVINQTGKAETVWNREGTIYACAPGKEEKRLGEGRNCTMESVNGKNVYAWIQDGHVIVMDPQGKKTDVGPGQLPVLKAADHQHVLCVFENGKKIQSVVTNL